MNKEIFRKIPKGIKLIIVLILLTVFGFGILFFADRPVRLPAEFLTARQKGAEISQKIVELTADTNQRIKEINALDINGDVLKAMAMIEEAKGKNREALDQALKLTGEMQDMAESLNKITLSKSREIAIKAIALEISLTTTFIVEYNPILDQFLSNLYKAIATSKIEYRKAAENNLSDLNAKTWAINSLNRQFLEQMREFDKSFSL
ncbi:hypothetical protein A3G50_01130 [Candidatus Jorgensenbacteria bacterium RIFCSPLOWO2_12_FULL_42_11]|uniref:DUF5667 domain-containing protein n=1 Tax=Candidatus Jorgensenbacteria bacterium RIFCSPLOWO2_12_FULL_42_11 TaxID=1798473 RepID=A0A1F6C223_9BACT|nr:MAG: hypothetical protein A3G50_01130 [Candidatus Jorgensenbacteria bacterium RIFCSPLOWO2_12_FULL_42_11]